MLNINVIKNTIIFDIIFVYKIPVFLFTFNIKIDFNILPPSNGNIGNKLNTAIKKFA